jgi:hypothetical protein
LPGGILYGFSGLTFHGELIARRKKKTTAITLEKPTDDSSINSNLSEQITSEIPKGV